MISASERYCYLMIMCYLILFSFPKFYNCVTEEYESHCEKAVVKHVFD